MCCHVSCMFIELHTTGQPGADMLFFRALRMDNASLSGISDRYRHDGLC